jgi:hypothetical protein
MKLWSLHFFLLVIVFAIAPQLHAEVGVVLNESLDTSGARVTGSGHTAIYFSNICPDSPIKLRLCRPGQQRSVMSNYTTLGEDQPYEWNIVPLSVYLYGVENPRDANHDGALSPQEKSGARIVLYGHSWGASQAITLARELQSGGVPVLLTIQVDSVCKRRQNDTVIPTNVAEAANFYQTTGYLHGETSIRAADPARTKILGNFKFDYSTHPIECSQYPWWDRYLVRAHTEIECDPVVWDKVEELIQSKLPQA